MSAELHKMVIICYWIVFIKINGLSWGQFVIALRLPSVEISVASPKRITDIGCVNLRLTLSFNKID